MKATLKQSAAAEVLSSATKIGEPFSGGFYAGRFYDAGTAYALIVAPKSGGELESTHWNESETLVKGALSCSNGLANTAAMAKAGSELAKWAQALEIGGFSDWHLPSRLESLLMFGELRSLEAFAPGEEDGIARDWYWTSTQYAGEPSYAWYQGFNTGYQGNGLKDDSLRARAVRRFAI